MSIDYVSKRENGGSIYLKIYLTRERTDFSFLTQPMEPEEVEQKLRANGVNTSMDTYSLPRADSKISRGRSNETEVSRWDSMQIVINQKFIRTGVHSKGSNPYLIPFKRSEDVGGRSKPDVSIRYKESVIRSPSEDPGVVPRFKRSGIGDLSKDPGVIPRFKSADIESSLSKDPGVSVRHIDLGVRNSSKDTAVQHKNLRPNESPEDLDFGYRDKEPGVSNRVTPPGGSSQSRSTQAGSNPRDAEFLDVPPRTRSRRSR